MGSRQFALIIFALGFLLSCGDSSPSGTETLQVEQNSVRFFQEDPEALMRGNAIYLGSCANFCHEYDLPNGNRLNLFDCHRIHGASIEEVSDVIRQGVEGTRMLGFGDNFPKPHDLKKLVAYLRSQNKSCDSEI